MNIIKLSGEKMDENIFDESRDADEVTYEDIKEIEDESIPLLESPDLEKHTGSSTRIQTYEDLVRMMAYRARNGFDSLTAWCGMRNVGKSVGAQHVAKLFQEKFGYKYDLARDTMFKDATVTNIMENIKSRPLTRAIILDEAEKYFYRMDWQSQEQNELIKFISFARIYRKHLFLLLPHFTDMRTSFRNTEITLWIQGLKQGFAAVFMQDTNLFEEDRWHMQENKKIWRKRSKGRNALDPNVQLNILSHTVNYIGDFHFPDLDAEWKKAYTERKLLALTTLNDTENFKTEREKKYYEGFLKLTEKLLIDGVSQSEIAKIAGISLSPISKVAKKLKESKEANMPDILRAGDI